jgi:hypothetical protein
MTIKQIKKDIKGVFKLPVKKYYIGKIQHGCPYFYPWYFNSNILTIRKERAQFLRCRYFKLFGYEISYGWPIKIVNYDLGWKDKFESPRFEWSPSFQIYFFKWQFCIWWVSPTKDKDHYWEMVLWYLHYSDKDIEKARETWGWVDFNTKLSTWNDHNLDLQYLAQY